MQISRRVIASRTAAKKIQQRIIPSLAIDTMVQFKNLSTSIAATSVVAAFTTFNSPLHVQAFAPTQNNVFSGYHISMPRYYATSLTAEADVSPISGAATLALDSRVAATAEYYSFVAAPNGRSGIMSIKFKEEDHTAAIPDIQVQAEVMTDSSKSGMFGGNAAQPKPATKQNKSTQGDDFIGKAVVFEDGRTGTIIAQRSPMAFVMCDFSDYEAHDMDSSHEKVISILGRRSTISVSDALFGSIIDCFGNPISVANVEASSCDAIDRAIFAPIPKVSDIALINSPILTGTAMVDALAPIGKGQNMLVVGQDTGVGQRDLVIGAVKTQVKNNGAKCIYAITSPDKKERADVIQMLKDAGVLDDIVVVCARDYDGIDHDEALKAADAAEAITVAAAACSIGEALALTKGEDTLVIVDNIDQHKSFWDWTTRVLIDKFGLDSVVKDDREGGASSEMRGFYSSLIQRAGKFNKKNGGGSMTLALLTNLAGQFGGADDDGSQVFSSDDFAVSSEKVKERIKILVDKKIPLTPENLRKIQIPLPSASDSEQMRRIALQQTDELISMSDGQIWLDESLYNKGQRPAMDAQRSITRIGIGADTTSRADAPAMRGLAGGLRFDFAQAESLEGAGENSGADKQVLKKKAYLLAMHQEGGQERILSDNCVVLLAASMRVLDDTIRDGGVAGTEKGQSIITGLLEHVQKTAPAALSEIDSSLDLSDSGRSELEDVIKNYFA